MGDVCRKIEGWDAVGVRNDIYMVGVKNGLSVITLQSHLLETPTINLVQCAKTHLYNDTTLCY